jgi:signal transduction histidine kinase
MRVRRGSAPVPVLAPALVPRAVVAGFAALVALVIGAVALLIAARVAGVSYWGTSPAIAVGFPIAVLVTTALGWWICTRGDAVVGQWVLATAGALLLYLVAVAVVTWAVAAEGLASPVLDWLALPAMGGFTIAFVLLQVSLLAARDRFAGWGDRRRPVIAALLALLVANLLLGAASLDPDPPLDRLQPPLGGTWLATVADSWVAAVLWIAWLLSVLVGPIALWRAVRRTSGMPRRRMSVAAVVSLLPVSVIVCCVLILPVLAVAELPERLAVDVLFAFFSVAFPLTAAGLAVAVSGREQGLRLHSRAFEVSLTVAVGVLSTLAAVAVSTLVAVTLADGSVPLVVVATVGVVALLAPLRRGVVRRLLRLADPRLALAADLVREVQAAEGERPRGSVRDVLRTALDDPGLEVAVRLPDGRSWVTVDGVDVGPPGEQDPEHLTVVTHAGGDPHAYVIHRTTPTDAAGIVGEARPLLERAVLEAAVRHQSERLAAERARADRAAEDERRRLERDLHDGVQGRLLAVALDLQAADAATRDGEAHLVLTDAVSSLRTAIEEMRRLATGSAPETLARHGLGPALDDLVRKLPVPVSVSVPDGRLDPTTETVAYLVVSEAVTNAVKHAGPCSVEVAVTLEDGRLGVTVSDDGGGGADVRAGTGLRGLAERVGAAGGTLVVSDRRPHGTVLEVALPCGR